jgi:hypothetical protein
MTDDHTHRGDDVHSVEAAEKDDDPWIKVVESKPQKGQEVWTYWGGDKYKNPVMIKNEYKPAPRGLGWSDWWCSRPNQEPTHWMPLPAAPTEGE